MQELTALKPFPYAGKNIRPNDDFTASDRDARLLIAIGKAKARVYDEPPAKATRRYKRRDLVAE
jgi:hypothetical protein